MCNGRPESTRLAATGLLHAHSGPHLHLPLDSLLGTKVHEEQGGLLSEECIAIVQLWCHHAVLLHAGGGKEGIAQPI